MQQILIYQDIADRLDQELAGLEPQPIYLGWNTDPYQPAEATHRQTWQALGLFAERGFSVCVLTKSDLVTRDLDRFLRMAGSSVGFSVAFQDEDVRRLFEANAPPNERRVRALKELKEAGIETYTLITPVMPFISDVESLIEMVAPYADTIWIYGLSMNAKEDRNWHNIQGILDCHFPEMTEQYRQIAFSADHPYWAEVRRTLERIQRERLLDLRIML
jgi:DNA repair photolyase